MTTSQPPIPIPIRLPSTLLPAFHLDLLLLSTLLKRNRAQHNSALFYQRAQGVERLGVRVVVELGALMGLVEEMGTGTVEDTNGLADAEKEEMEAELEGRRQMVLSLIVNLLPATVKATEHANKMIHHLHFLPLVTVLLGIFSRLWLLSLDVLAQVSPPPLLESSTSSIQGVNMNLEGQNAEAGPGPSTYKRTLSIEKIIFAGARDEEARERLELSQRPGVSLEDAEASSRERAEMKKTKSDRPMNVDVDMGMMMDPETAMELGTKIEREISPMMDAGEDDLIDSTSLQGVIAPNTSTSERAISPSTDFPISPSETAPPIARSSSPAHLPLALENHPVSHAPLRSTPPVQKKKRKTRPAEADLDDMFGILDGSGMTGAEMTTEKKAKKVRKVRREVAVLDVDMPEVGQDEKTVAVGAEAPLEDVVDGGESPRAQEGNRGKSKKLKKGQEGSTDTEEPNGDRKKAKKKKKGTTNMDDIFGF